MAHIHGYSAKFIFPDCALVFQDKMNRFPWLICLCEIPILAFNRLQSHYKRRWQNKFKSGGTNNLQAKQAEKIWTVVCSLRKTVHNFFCMFVNFCTRVLWFSLTSPWLLLTIETMTYSLQLTFKCSLENEPLNTAAVRLASSNMTRNNSNCDFLSTSLKHFKTKASTKTDKITHKDS